MPLAKLPYTYKITAKTTNPDGSWLLTVQILDGNAVVRATVQQNFIPEGGLAELRQVIHRLIDTQMVADAGTRDNWLAGVIAGGGVLPG